MEEARFRISKEFFPVNGRKPKARRSVAQKLIKHFLALGLDPTLLSDLMLFYIETAIRYNERKPSRQEANGLKGVHKERLEQIQDSVEKQEWMNTEGFERVMLN